MGASERERERERERESWHEMQIVGSGTRLEPGSGRYHIDDILVNSSKKSCCSNHMAPAMSWFDDDWISFCTQIRTEWWHHLVEWTNINGWNISHWKDHMQINPWWLKLLMPVHNFHPPLTTLFLMLDHFCLRAKGNKNVNTEGKYLYVPVFRRPPNVLPEEDRECKSC